MYNYLDLNFIKEATPKVNPSNSRLKVGGTLGPSSGRSLEIR
jgi:hypothetical protein